MPVLPGLCFFPLSLSLNFLPFLERESNMLSMAMFSTLDQSRCSQMMVVISGWLAS